MGFNTSSYKKAAILVGYVLLNVVTFFHRLQGDPFCLSGTNYVLPSPSLCAASIAFSPDGSYLVTVNYDTNDTDNISVNLATFRMATNGRLSNATSSAFPISFFANPTPTALAFLSNGLYLVAIDNYYINFEDIVVFQVGYDGILQNPTLYSLPSYSGVPVSVASSGPYVITASYGQSANKNNCLTVFQRESNGTLSDAKSYGLPENSFEPIVAIFAPNEVYVATANNSDDITMFQVGPNGTLSGAVSYNLPDGVYGLSSIAFSPNSLYLAAANSGSNHLVIFNVGAGGILNSGTLYPLPKKSSSASSLAFSSDGMHLVAANQYSNDITMFQFNADGTLDKGASYSLPHGASAPVAVTFSPNGLYFATANCGGNNNPGSVTVFKIESSCHGDDNLPVALIVGPIIGAGIVTFTLIAVLVGCYILYKRGALNLTAPLSLTQSYASYSSIRGGSHNVQGMPESAYYAGSNPTVVAEESSQI